MILFPNCKINIGLSITSRRPDGYHNLSTLFYPVNWCDILEIVPAKGLETTLTVTGREVLCPPEKNLVVKAWRRLNDAMPIPSVDIYLHKIIPDGAGLGGGSSDAAFTLRGLNEMFGLGLTDGELAAMARDLGADCPFFIYDRPTMASGIGDEFSPHPLSLRGVAIGLVKPRESVSTAEAYSGVVPTLPEWDLHSVLLDDITTWQPRVVNDFERSIFPAHPAIASVKEQLAAMGAAYVSMSGSGAAVYGLFPGADADILAERLAETFPGCDTHATLLD